MIAIQKVIACYRFTACNEGGGYGSATSYRRDDDRPADDRSPDDPSRDRRNPARVAVWRDLTEVRRESG
jgi:hypothetical protein